MKFTLPDSIKRFLFISPHIKLPAETDQERLLAFIGLCPRGLLESELDRDFLAELQKPAPIIQDQSLPITQLMYLVHQARPDLQATYDLNKDHGRKDYLGWFDDWGTKQYFRQNPYQVQNVGFESNGINLIGFKNATMGLGEVLRSTKAALNLCQVPTATVDTQAADNVAKLDYRINIACLPGMENYRLLYTFGQALFRSRYHICYWPWELSDWPESLNFCFEKCDEVWAISEFSRESLAKSTRKPVIRMPLPIPTPTPARLSRHDFGLNSETFYFLSVFDFNSYIERKNPTGAFKAFQKAFPNNPNVGIVFKTINLNEDSPEAIAFLQLVAGDERVKIINRSLGKDELWSLMDLCNSYVSLHRAEGFGLPIAEAMLLGKPVVCTAYSGSMDFTHEDNSFIVKYNLVKIPPGAYHFASPGATWAEPDIEDAAGKMLQIFMDPGLSKARADRGRALIASEYSLAAVGNAMRTRLQQCGLSNTQG